MGTVQNDVKRVIAYSTCSQLGYMVVAQSMSHYGLAMYHLMTHACFKALLFQGAGVVIHASLDVQDMRRSGGAHSAQPLAWAVLLLGSLSLLGWPFQAGYYSKDAIQEVSLRSSGALSAYGHLIQMTVALLTSAYSFRVLLLVFYAPAAAKKNRLRVPGVPFSMTRPQCILGRLSIFRGYFLSDRTIGWGTDFWGTSLLYSPGTNRRVRSHMIPVWVSALPYMTVFLGQRAATVFVYRGPLAFCQTKIFKSLYIFLRTRWGFDFVWNSQISFKVLMAGRRTWKSIDKGVLELQGPRGITTTQTSWIVPSVQKFSTGAVHDYALLLQILIVVGLLLLAYPMSSQDMNSIGLSFSFKTATLLFFFYVISVSYKLFFFLHSVFSCFWFFLEGPKNQPLSQKFAHICKIAVWRSGIPREAHDLKAIVQIYLLHMWLQVFCFCIQGTALVLSIPLKGLLSVVQQTPAVGSFCQCIQPGKERKTHRLVALLFSQRTQLQCMRLWSGFSSVFPDRSSRPFSQLVSYQIGWRGFFTVSLEFGLDRLSLWMILLTAFQMPLAILASWTTQKGHSSSFYALLLILTTFQFRCFTRTDQICFYVLYECAQLPMFLLIGQGGSRARKVKAAYLLVLYTLFGSLAMQPLLLLLYSRTGTTNYELLRHFRLSESREYILWWGFFQAFAVKVPLMPLHLWLPEAHVERSTAGSVLLAGVLLKLGTYRLLRFNLYLFPARSAYFYPFVSTVCLVGIIYASQTTLRQVDLKKIVAYSSVAHMSMVVLALFTMNEVGIIGSIFTMQAHGIRSPALFQCVGYLYDRTHTKAQKYLGGCATAMPLFSIWFFFFTLCNMAMPLTPNFVGEFLSLCGIFAQNSFSQVLSQIGVILSAVYSQWAYARVVHGMPKGVYVASMADQNRREWWTLAVLFFLRVWFGIKPGYILDSQRSTVYYWNSSIQSNFFIYPLFFFFKVPKENYK